jgi:hypothetical protein
MNKRRKEEVKTSDFKVSNIQEIIKKYNPLINKLAYQFYSRYNSVLDFNDAKQEITICLYRCLVKYNGEKTFIAYFRTSVARLMSRFYYSYFHSIEINQNTVDTRESDEDDSSKPTFDWLVNQNRESQPRRLRPLLSSKNQRLYDLFMKEGKISKWLIAKKLKVSRFYADKKYESFKKELAIITDRRIY